MTLLSCERAVQTLLGVHQLDISMRGWDVNQDRQFYLQLIDTDDKIY